MVGGAVENGDLRMENGELRVERGGSHSGTNLSRSER